jgi:hypothetical protein
MSDKTIDEVLKFIRQNIEKAEEAEVWTHVNAFKIIEKYIEDQSPALTPDELSQMKETITNMPVTRRAVDDEEDGE